MLHSLAGWLEWNDALGGAIECPRREGGTRKAAGRGVEPVRLIAMGAATTGQNGRMPKVCGCMKKSACHVV